MSVQAVDRHLPEVLTLDGLALANDADTHGYRYELSPEGVLSVMPPPDFAHAQVINRLIEWLLAAGWTLKQIYQAVGLRIPGRDGGDGGRIPDLVVWNRPLAPEVDVWLPTDGIEVVVEVISRNSKVIDKRVKRDEYAGAGISRYWTVDCDAARTVTMYELVGDRYKSRLIMALDWVLNTEPSDYLG